MKTSFYFFPEIHWECHHPGSNPELLPAHSVRGANKSCWHQGGLPDNRMTSWQPQTSWGKSSNIYSKTICFMDNDIASQHTTLKLQNIFAPTKIRLIYSIIYIFNKESFAHSYFGDYNNINNLNCMKILPKSRCFSFL